MNVSRPKFYYSLGILTVLTAMIYSFFDYKSATKILHTSSNEYGPVWVYENQTERCLSFDPPHQGTRQSCLLLKNPEHLALDYQKMILGALYLNPTPPKSVLMIGLGGGSMANALLTLLPDIHLDIVEINPAIPNLAKQFFSFKPSENTTVFINNGLLFASSMRYAQKYDLIIVDAFGKDYVPPDFLSTYFIHTLKNHLNPQGVVAVNTFQSSRFYHLESQLYQTAFGAFFNLTTNNRVILAKHGPLPSQASLTERAEFWQAPFKALGVAQEWLLPKFTVLATEHAYF